MRIDSGMLTVEWEAEERAEGAFLSHDHNLDFYGTVVLKMNNSKEIFDSVPILSFIRAFSWHIAIALFTGERVKVELLEYPTLFEVEITPAGKARLFFGGFFFEYALTQLCRSLGHLEIGILSNFLKGPEDLQSEKVTLNSSFVGEKVFELYMQRMNPKSGDG